MALPIISGITFSTGTPPQGPIGSTATITGSGFGATQGGSEILVQNGNGSTDIVAPQFWSATSITVVLDPFFLFLREGDTRHFTLLLGGEIVGVSTPNFLVVPDPTPIASLPVGQQVFNLYATPGSFAYPPPPEGPPSPSRGAVTAWEGGTNYTVTFLTSGAPVLGTGVPLATLGVVREPLLTYMNLNHLFEQNRR